MGADFAPIYVFTDMRKIILSIALASVLALSAAGTYDETSAKARRFFDNSEWASASAMCNFMLHERPAVPSTYGMAIVSTQMQADTLRSMQLLGEAMRYGVPLDSVLEQVRRYSYAIGHAQLYENFMLQAARENSWMARPIDVALLKYYNFRDNGPKIVEYANRMLDGAPDNIQFLDLLAHGLMLQDDGPGALQAWRRIVELHPDNYRALLQIANYSRLVGEDAEALAYFRRAQSLRATPYVAQAIQELSDKKTKK